MAAIIVLVLFALLSVAVLMGWTVDSRDSDYDLGPVFDPPSTPFAGAVGR
jgi:hypothetical protein